MNNTKYILLRDRIGSDTILGLIYENGKLIRARRQNTEPLAVGDIYLAKIDKVSKSMHGAFVILPGKTAAFLPEKELQRAILTGAGRLGKEPKAGDTILVQVDKPASKEKPISVSCEISLSGKYAAVLVRRNNNQDILEQFVRYSAKLTAKDKELLGKISVDIKLGVVYRTACKELAQYDDCASQYTDYIGQEVESLQNQAMSIYECAFYRTDFSCLCKAKLWYVDFVSNDIGNHKDEVITDDCDIYEEVKDLHPNVRLYQDELLPLRKLYSVDSKIHEALSDKVWLDCGGYLFIEQTHALCAIDVNSGKTDAKKDAKETIFAVNMQACDEIMHQIMLRNLSGMILIDFINMDDSAKTNQLLERMRELAKMDYVKCEVIDMTALSLMEIVREKKLPPLSEQMK